MMQFQDTDASNDSQLTKLNLKFDKNMNLKLETTIDFSELSALASTEGSTSAAASTSPSRAQSRRQSPRCIESRRSSVGSEAELGLGSLELTQLSTDAAKDAFFAQALLDSVFTRSISNVKVKQLAEGEEPQANRLKRKLKKQTHLAELDVDGPYEQIDEPRRTVPRSTPSCSNRAPIVESSPRCLNFTQVPSKQYALTGSLLPPPDAAKGKGSGKTPKNVRAPVVNAGYASVKTPKKSQTPTNGIAPMAPHAYNQPCLNGGPPPPLSFEEWYPQHPGGPVCAQATLSNAPEAHFAEVVQNVSTPGAKRGFLLAAPLETPNTDRRRNSDPGHHGGWGGPAHVWDESQWDGSHHHHHASPHHGGPHLPSPHHGHGPHHMHHMPHHLASPHHASPHHASPHHASPHWDGPQSAMSPHKGPMPRMSPNSRTSWTPQSTPRRTTTRGGRKGAKSPGNLASPYSGMRFAYAVSADEPDVGVPEAVPEHSPTNVAPSAFTELCAEFGDINTRLRETEHVVYED